VFAKSVQTVLDSKASRGA